MGKFTKETARQFGDKGRAVRYGKESGKIGKKQSSSRRRKALETAAWWVFTHEDNAKPPNPACRRLQAMAKEDPVAFMRGVLFPALPAAPKVEEEKGKTEKGVLGGSLEALERFMAEGPAGEAGEHPAPASPVEGVWSG